MVRAPYVLCHSPGCPTGQSRGGERGILSPRSGCVTSGELPALTSHDELMLSLCRKEGTLPVLGYCSRAPS